MASAAYPGRISVEVIADGGVPAGTEGIYDQFATTHHVNAGNNRRSFSSALQCAIERVNEGFDLVLFCEDDYIYTHDSLVALGAAHIEAPDAYLALYTPHDNSWHRTHPSQPLRPMKQDERPTPVGWRQISHPTSSYAVPGSALMDDKFFLKAVMYSGGPFAHSTGAMIQGVQPFSWLHLTRDLNLRGQRKAILQGLSRIPTRAGVNVLAIRMRTRRRRYLAPQVDLITHVETAHLSPGEHWRSISEAAATSAMTGGSALE